MPINIFNIKQAPYWILANSFLIGLTVPTLIKDGMFMDAMLYTSVSHNLSMGIGSFWFPQFSVHNVAGLSSFHEQPPLVFGIQSLFFKFFGDSMYVERFYTFATMCITALLIVYLWKEIYRRQDGLIKLGWLPLILWITIPVCFWSYSNNMHENTMGIFTLSAVLFIYKSFTTEISKNIYLLFTGIFIFLASLSKGIPGFFPITAPFLYWLTTKKISFRISLIQTFIITFIPILIYLVLFLIPESNDSLSIYFFKRALHRINEVPTVDSRFYILGRIFMELIPQFILVIIFLFIAKRKNIEMIKNNQIREIIFFILMGLSASTPLMLTLVQKGFYFVPSLPFFAVGLSMIIAPTVLHFLDRINIHSKQFKIFFITSSFILLGTIAFSFLQTGKVSRNKEMLHDVYLIGTNVPKQSLISIPAEMWDEWDLQCYLVRYFNISLDTEFKNDYCIIDRNMNLKPPLNYQKINIETFRFDLYERQ